MVDQVAIFFLAGHETSASALGWALYLLARYPDWQDRLAEEAEGALCARPRFRGDVPGLRLSRDVFREALRLYPPVPMMVRRDDLPPNVSATATCRWAARSCSRPGTCTDTNGCGRTPTASTPRAGRPENGRQCLREAFIPFSAGARVCTGAGFAMVEGPLLLSMLVARRSASKRSRGRDPMPVAYLTVRREGRHLVEDIGGADM